MPTLMQTWNKDLGKWIEFGQVGPWDNAGSINHHSALGDLQIFLVECAPSDRFTDLYLVHRGGTNTKLGGQLTLAAFDANDIVRIERLRHDEEHEFTAITNPGASSRRIKLRHHAIDFGKRHCEICGKDIPAPTFGRHVMSHDVELWPGGPSALVAALRKSTKDSIRCADGFPGVQRHLRENWQRFEQVLRRSKAQYN